MNARHITIVAALVILAVPLRVFAQTDAALQLYASLSDEQKKEATLPFDSPKRNEEVFTGGKRAGVQIRTLDEKQQKLALDMLTSFCSDYGKQKALAITEQKPDNPADQPGFGRYYVCYFGNVGPGKTYAWRIAEHHLTIVQVEMEKGEPKSFGPVLLGANPPTLWDDEEDKMIDLFAKMSPDERQKSANPGKGISSTEVYGKTVRVGDLNPSAKEAAKSVFEGRLKFFADPIRERVMKIVDAQGGLDAMNIAFYGGEATKRCRDGGRWDFKMGGAGFLCDYENSRAHIHLSMKTPLKAASPAEKK